MQGATKILESTSRQTARSDVEGACETRRQTPGGEHSAAIGALSLDTA